MKLPLLFSVLFVVAINTSRAIATTDGKHVEQAANAGDAIKVPRQDVKSGMASKPNFKVLLEPKDSNADLPIASFTFESANFERNVVADAHNNHGEDKNEINITSELKEQKRLLFISSRSISRRWTQARVSGRTVIPYQFGDGGLPTSIRNDIRRYLDEIEDRTGCLTFKVRGNERNYINIIGNRDGCSSRIGEGSGGGNLILGWCRDNKGSIQHEFLHALGFEHEHRRPDRDQYVTINFNNIKSSARGRYATLPGSTLGSPYDYDSVMHYHKRASSSNGEDTIVTRNGARIGQRNGPSDIDIQKVKLYYQCEGGATRQWNELINSPCTSNCKCQSGQSGCGSNNNACHGSLVCSNNKCVSGSNPTPTPPSPTPSPSPSGRPWLIWQINPDDGRVYCMDLRGANTANGNDVWYYRCNYTPAQYWYYDSNRYLRSSIDRNKCLIPSGGSTEQGKRLMIWDCWQNDDRFKWDWYSADNSIRPRNNPFVCLEPCLPPRDSFSSYLILDGCFPNWSAFHWIQQGSRRVLKHEDHYDNAEKEGKMSLVPPPPRHAHQQKQKEIVDGTDSKIIPASHHFVRRSISVMEGQNMDTSHSDGCADFPPGWYDIFGRNCEWYADDQMNCEIYGSLYKNFGKTAMQACCVCGDTVTMMKEELNMTDAMTESEMTALMMENMNSTTCWDMPDWYDSAGYGCDWYAEGGNCDMYGDDYMGMGSMSDQSASSACCACGGGQSIPPSMMEKNETSMPGCSESPFGWTADTQEEGDDEIIDCAWYSTSAEDDLCSKYGDWLGTNNKTAKEACCECRGSNDGNKEENPEVPPTSSGVTSKMFSCSSLIMSCATALLGIALLSIAV